LGELAIARAEGTYRKAMAMLAKVQLLIIDEWLLYDLKDTEARDLLEITESRCKKASTIFCSQFDLGGRHEKIGEPTLADAVCDRIVHDSYILVVKSDPADSINIAEQRTKLWSYRLHAHLYLCIMTNFLETTEKC